MDGVVAAFPPTYKNGYERLYRFVDERTDQPRSSYDNWARAKIGDRIDELDGIGVHYARLRITFWTIMSP